MGAYLNKPVTEKHSETGEGAGLKYGATCMQGWRVNQEDAHNCNLDLVEGWSLFAVYDGHGGSEVSKYTAMKFPDFLKESEFWKEDDLTKALEKIFVNFDDHIRSAVVMKELQKMANEGKSKTVQREEDSEDESDRIKTIEESRLPLEDILAKYGYTFRVNPDPKSLLSAICQDDGEEDNASKDKKKRHSKSPSQAQAKRAKTDTDSADPEDPKPSSEQNEQNDAVEIGKASADDSDEANAPEEPQPSVANTEKVAEESAEIDNKNEPEAIDDDTSDEEDADFEGEGEDDDEEEDEEEEEEEEDSDENIFFAGGGDTPGEDSGTTACVCLISKDKIMVANAGDSRAVLSRGGVAINLSEDHKPEDEKERQRIEKAGGCVNGDGRVNGGLNLSRAFGDHCYKKNTDLKLEEQMISALPDVKIEDLKAEDDFVVIACDGIWNSLESQDVVDFVKAGFAEGKNCQQIAEDLCEKCLADSTAGDGTGCDNMTVIITQIAH